MGCSGRSEGSPLTVAKPFVLVQKTCLVAESRAQYVYVPKCAYQTTNLAVALVEG